MSNKLKLISNAIIIDAFIYTVHRIYARAQDSILPTRIRLIHFSILTILAVTYFIVWQIESKQKPQDE
jgi:hypothetical protein